MLYDLCIIIDTLL